MPKPHYSYNKQSNWDRSDRDYRGDRRVTFKPSRHGGKKNKDFNHAVQHLDDDIDMAGGSGKNFKKMGKKGGRRGSPAPNGYRKLIEGPTSWYRVSIPHGDKYEKSFLLKTLLDKVTPLPFWPVCWQTFGTTCVFYIDDYQVAEKLRNINRDIQLPNGFRLYLKVHPGTPNVDMTSSIKERIKLAMAKRYNTATKALDLTKFHADPDLQDLFCALFKPIVLLTVVDIIGENIPELEALNLYDNKLSALVCLKKVIKKLPNLKILHIGNNKIRDIQQFDALIGLPIVDLVLDGNPLCDKFKDQVSYISEVRKRFPKCMKLDGKELDPPIVFDIAEEGDLPSPQQTFLCAAEGEGIVRQFLQQYFQIYDTDNRQPLLKAYHEQAMFSMTMGYPHGFGKDKSVPWLNWYQNESRNIMRITDSERRVKLLRQGHLAVVSFLQEMPETKHDILSFTVDLTVFTPTMLCLIVTGMFKEVKSGHKVPPLRYFFRTLVIVPSGTGFCIVNEELHITNATPDQAKEAFKTPAPALAPEPEATMSVTPPPATITAPPVVLDDATKQEMVQQLSLKTGMNLEWSIKCLEETQWDFFRAGAAFEDAQKRGLVPPDAFIK